MNSRDDRAREYWEKNIRGFSGFYDKRSEERFETNPILERLYRALVLPVEKKYMRERHRRVLAFIECNVQAHMSVADIGCGSGIYTQELARRCRAVYAIDFAREAIELTENRLLPEEKKQVRFLCVDATKEPIPDVDCVLAIGVLPYIADVNLFFANVLPHTGRIYFNYLDSANPANRLRRMLPLLDVRHYSYHENSLIADALREHGFCIQEQRKLATGVMVNAERRQ